MSGSVHAGCSPPNPNLGYEIDYLHVLKWSTKRLLWIKVIFSMNQVNFYNLIYQPMLSYDFNGAGLNWNCDVISFINQQMIFLKCPQNREHCFYGIIKQLKDRIRLKTSSKPNWQIRRWRQAAVARRITTCPQIFRLCNMPTSVASAVYTLMLLLCSHWDWEAIQSWFL